MKIIRPEQPIKKQLLNEMTAISQECKLYDEELIDDNTSKDQTIENLMNEIIKQKDDKIQITISLTKRQYDLYIKKGGEAWLKKALVGQGNIRKKKR